MMSEYQKEQADRREALEVLTVKLAAALGAPWKKRPLREDRDEVSYPSRWIVNGNGAELIVKIEEYGAKKGRVSISGSLWINNECPTVYENGNRLSVPDISVNPERGVEVIAKEVKRRLLPEYLRILALAQAQVAEQTRKTNQRQQIIRDLCKITGGACPDFTRDSDRFYLPGDRHGTLTVHYDGSASFERLSCSREEAEFILRYLYRSDRKKGGQQ